MDTRTDKMRTRDDLNSEIRKDIFQNIDDLLLNYLNSKTKKDKYFTGIRNKKSAKKLLLAIRKLPVRENNFSLMGYSEIMNLIFSHFEKLHENELNNKKSELYTQLVNFLISQVAIQEEANWHECLEKNENAFMALRISITDCLKRSSLFTSKEEYDYCYVKWQVSGKKADYCHWNKLIDSLKTINFEESSYTKIILTFQIALNLPDENTRTENKVSSKNLDLINTLKKERSIWTPKNFNVLLKDHLLERLKTQNSIENEIILFTKLQKSEIEKFYLNMYQNILIKYHDQYNNSKISANLCKRYSSKECATIIEYAEKKYQKICAQKKQIASKTNPTPVSVTTNKPEKSDSLHGISPIIGSTFCPTEIVTDTPFLNTLPNLSTDLSTTAYPTELVTDTPMLDSLSSLNISEVFTSVIDMMTFTPILLICAFIITAVFFWDKKRREDYKLKHYPLFFNKKDTAKEEVPLMIEEGISKKPK